jgi:hypothetical protein
MGTILKAKKKFRIRFRIGSAKTYLGFCKRQ